MVRNLNRQFYRIEDNEINEEAADEYGIFKRAE